MADSKDILISFDTTGSMRVALAQVRQQVHQLVDRLFKDIPNVRIGIIAHGDYCDEHTSYITKMLDLTTEKAKICHFIQNVEDTHGGDAPECYEFVLNQARSASWQSGNSKSLIMIGDDLPHLVNDHQNFKKLDWKNEAKLLHEAGVNIYSVQALGRRHATSFWKEMATITKGYHLSLNQFQDIRNLILAVGYKQVSNEQLVNYEQELIINGLMNRNIGGMIDSMLGRDCKHYEYSTSETSTDKSVSTDETLRPVSSGRFQVLSVSADTAIKEFVIANGVEFKVGRGFYQFTKRTEVQAHKEIILRNKTTGDFFTGNGARKIAKIPVGTSSKVSPEGLPDYDVFIQSTSVNRKLVGGTQFLYEIPDWKE